MSETDETLNRTYSFYSKAAERDFFKVPPKHIQIIFAAQIEEKLVYNLSPTIKFEHLDEGMIELKINGSPAYRCVYTMKQPGKVVILHTFAKTTNGPDVKNVRLARKRAKSLK